MFVVSVLLFCILAVFVYLCDYADCFNRAFVLQDFNKRIQRVQSKCLAKRPHRMALLSMSVREWSKDSAAGSGCLHVSFRTIGQEGLNLRSQ